MSKYYDKISITGVANTTTYDTGIISTESEKRIIKGVYLNLSGHIGNDIIITIDREIICTIPDYLIDTDMSSGSTNVQNSVTKQQFFELDFILKTGAKMQVGILCGASAKDVRGCYLYEL